TTEPATTTLDELPRMPRHDPRVDDTARPQPRARPKRAGRAALAGLVVSAVLGGGLAAAMLTDDTDRAPGPRPVPSTLTATPTATRTVTRTATRLDQRGIPTWWVASGSTTATRAAGTDDPSVGRRPLHEGSPERFDEVGEVGGRHLLAV